MARIVARILPLVYRSLPFHPSPSITTALWWRPLEVLTASPILSSTGHFRIFLSCSQIRGFHISFPYLFDPASLRTFFAPFRGFRKVKRRPAARKQVSEENKLELRAKISIEEGLSDDHEVVNITEMLKLDVPMAMKMAFDGLKELDCRAQGSIGDISKYEQIVLSILLCNDELTTKLNKECKGVDFPTDVFVRTQNVQEFEIPILMLGDIVISAEAALRQAEEKGHTLLDEIRYLVMQGLLHVLGYDGGSDETVAEKEKLEELVLESLGWKGRGPATVTYDFLPCGIQSQIGNGKMSNAQREARNVRFYRPKFSHIFCNMGGTLLNSQGQVSTTTIVALREALSRGVKIVIATEKTRPAAISVLKMVELDGKNGIVSEVSPGIFLQALLYSLEHKVPLIAFSHDRCLTLFDHPLLDSLHALHHEPKVEFVTSVEHLLKVAVQKIIFLGPVEDVSSVIRPHWEEAADGRVLVVQVQPHILEIIPTGTSKADGVKVLLDHLGISPKEIMAIGTGESDVEMLELASLGVALENGSEKTKAVADVIGSTNDDDGVAMAIYQYAF
ncbi:uncharacterized protein LOC110038924 isoform X2 [Phalaenopsis equestris]|uniref:uncharacterized protein LOC110038924 isoform X2 n=1 Tax=Phalaenopsis equestris TaxID=78828 RepID=UPI0009E35FFE|nr:uncharacterized protein LOC110038924 isoform X2 [Phalaenopsis equestris]